MNAKNYFPNDVLKFIKLNVAPRQTLKWMKVCKYFQYEIFPFHPIYYVELFFSSIEYQSTPLTAAKKELYQNNNFWLKGSFIAYFCQGQMSKFISKIAYCNIADLTLHYQNISIQDLQFLTSTGNVERLNWENTNVFNKYGRRISLEDILNCVKNVEEIEWEDSSTSFISISTAKNVYLPKLKKFVLTENPAIFNLKTFLPFLVNHNHSAFNIFLDCWEDEINDFRKEYEMEIENSVKIFKPVKISQNIRPVRGEVSEFSATDS